MSLDPTQLPGWWKVDDEVPGEGVVRTDGVRIVAHFFPGWFDIPSSEGVRIHHMPPAVRRGLGLDEGASALEIHGETVLEAVSRVDRASPPVPPRLPPPQPLPLGFHFVADPEGRLLLKGDTDAGLRWVNSLLRDAQK